MGKGLNLTTGIRLVQMVSISERKFLHLQPMIGTQTRVRNLLPRDRRGNRFAENETPGNPCRPDGGTNSPRQKKKLSSPVNHTGKKGCRCKSHSVFEGWLVMARKREKRLGVEPSLLHACCTLHVVRTVKRVWRCKN